MEETRKQVASISALLDWTFLRRKVQSDMVSLRRRIGPFFGERSNLISSHESASFLAYFSTSQQRNNLMLQRQRRDLDTVLMHGQIDFQPHAEVAREVDAGLDGEGGAGQ